MNDKVTREAMIRAVDSTKKPTQLYVEIEGGVLVDIRSDRACAILVIDRDSMAMGEPPQLWTIIEEKEIDAESEYLHLLSEKGDKSNE